MALIIGSPASWEILLTLSKIVMQMSAKHKIAAFGGLVRFISNQYRYQWRTVVEILSLNGSLYQYL
jgi:cupin superfamily acireductone dioxygenase involved in methionine salvage